MLDWVGAQPSKKCIKSCSLTSHKWHSHNLHSNSQIPISSMKKSNRGQILQFQSLPEDITRIVRTFANDLVTSLQESLKRVPQSLVSVKMKCKNICRACKKPTALLFFFFPVVRQLSHCLKRRTSVNHLYQAASLVISPTNAANSYQCLQTVNYLPLLEIITAY